MIARLAGRVDSLSGNHAVIDVQGVGYEVSCTRDCLRQLVVGEEAQITIYTAVKEDSISLYGFGDTLEKQVFCLLMSVKGLGARRALDVISQIDKVDLLRCIGEGNTAALQTLKRVGKRLAERIVVELKDKVAEYVLSRKAHSPQVEKVVIEPTDDAVEALLALGFSRKEAEHAVGKVELSALPEKADTGTSRSCRRPWVTARSGTSLSRRIPNRSSSTSRTART